MFIKKNSTANFEKKMKQLFALLAVLSALFASEHTCAQAMAPSTGYSQNVVIPPNFSQTMFVKQKRAPNLNNS